MTNKTGGYDVEFVHEDIYSNYSTCSICLLVLREPMQAQDCGHRFCKSCLVGLKKCENDDYICPEDRSSMKLFSDKGREREILGILVKCTNNKSGGEWKNELRQLEDHQLECGYEETKCVITSCSKRVQRRMLDLHHATECIYRFTTCLYCTEEYMHCDEEDHMLECEEFLLCCDYCTEAKIPRKKMDGHISNDCVKVPHSCPFKTIGCHEKLLSGELAKHNPSSIENHLLLALNQINRQNEKIIKLQENLQKANRSQNNALIELRSSSVFSQVHVFKIQNFAQSLSFKEYFYSPHGYKFKTWTTLNGESDISLWFQTVQSPFDDALEWPMKLEYLRCVIINKRLKGKLPRIMWNGTDDMNSLILKPPHMTSVGWNRFIRSPKLASMMMMAH
uniref:Uncharacterized protein n=1 Tax=Clytia hemisphaerica TaxID=252671 RepID=A0A7M5UG47_9CNID